MKETHLHDYFQNKGAKMIEFAGWHMPVWFTSIVKEHLAVREKVGIFDVTHMGRILITGKDAESFLNHITTNNVEKLKVKRLHYSTICNPNGGIKDDIMLQKAEEERFILVCNASNREKIYNWIIKNSKEYEVKIENVSDQVPMFAIQGPYAEKTMQKVVDIDLAKMKHWRLREGKIDDLHIILTRSGYTGEDGFEITLWRVTHKEKEKAIKIYEKILEAGREYGIAECGLGARDTLRLEAGLLLYGNDIDEETTPFEARINFAVKMDKGEFIGREALQKQLEEGLKKIRIGLKMIDKGIPRPHYEIYREDKKIGTVTSGTYSPLLKMGIAMGYVKPEYNVENLQVEVVIRGRKVKAKVVNWPFYDPTKYGRRRVK
ncbi:MAG: glycine cleavage system aminomethyltransferase GcvT [archaeon GB-1867-097]|nr:glycine cleavage system aminomethyltransferase GcvT [Candidatus Culexmicrobium thermophilum]MCS7384686.1 glycine cleavage system aminomethyltransferase GcvT [Candidatus Culexmicrobium thermophilum]